MPNYKLLITKGRKPKRIYKEDKTNGLYFCIIDLDKGSFPENFVCVLPKIKLLLKNYSNYSRIFYAGDRLKLASELLESAKQVYRDSSILDEIDERLAIVKNAYISEAACTPFQHRLLKLRQ